MMKNIFSMLFVLGLTTPAFAQTAEKLPQLLLGEGTTGEISTGESYALVWECVGRNEIKQTICNQVQPVAVNRATQTVVSRGPVQVITLEAREPTNKEVRHFRKMLEDDYYVYAQLNATEENQKRAARFENFYRFTMAYDNTVFLTETDIARFRDDKGHVDSEAAFRFLFEKMKQAHPSK